MIGPTAVLGSLETFGNKYYVYDTQIYTYHISKDHFNMVLDAIYLVNRIC